MTTEAERTIALARLVSDAENSAYAAELDLAAAQAEIIQLRDAMEGQQRLIDALNHNAVLALEAHRRVVAERDALCARLMGGIWVWEIEGSAN